MPVKYRPPYVKYITSVTEEGIFGFFGSYRWLSNFYYVDIHIDGKVYTSSEAAYMSRKTFLESEKQMLTTLAPKEAKNYGQQVSLRPDWEEVKYDEMLKVIRLKFTDASLAEKLLSTGDLYLEETNHWGDTYWGVCDGVGHNNLGKILMSVRDELRTEKSNVI